MIVVVDYAKVDGNLPPDWGELQRACRAGGASLGAAIFRGAYGTSPDDTVGRDWKRAQAAGLTTGAYLFLRMRPDQPPEDQVHVFADNVGALTWRDLVPCIDVEDTGLSAEAELEWVHRAWTEMRSIYGVPPMLYDSDRVWHEDLHNLPAGEMIDSPQWVAKPWPFTIRTTAALTPRTFIGGKYEPVVPKPWGPGNWWMHQYQGDAFPVPGFSHTVDLSRFHMMYQGETGVRVQWVQRRLSLPITGVFDAVMASRLRTFQSSHGLVSDGVIGPRTFASICWINPLNPTSSPLAA